MGTQLPAVVTNPAEPSAKQDQLIPVSFRTDVLNIWNQTGKRIRAYLDVPVGVSDYSGVTLIAPAYGETKENNLLISSHFVANGYCAVRFDWTDHVGESDGEIFDSTLSKMRSDLTAAIDYMRRVFAGYKLGVIASSLAARVALKVAARDKALDFLVCFTPVVNLQGTLAMVYREDLVASFQRGRRYGSLNILGFTIDADTFLADAVQAGFADFASSLADALCITIPTFLIIGQRDAWVNQTEADRILAAINCRTKETLVFPTMLHRLVENTKIARDALCKTVKSVIHATTTEQSNYTIRHPAPQDLTNRVAQEKEHLRKLYVFSRSEEKHFWKQYLQNFQYIVNVHDFYNLLDFIYNSFGGAWAGQKVLDAGCGIGNYGLFLLTKQLYRYRQGHPLKDPICYYGLDFVISAISDATVRMKQLSEEFRKPQANGWILDPIRTHFLIGDLDTELPFRENFFDQICCNLVISYLQAPKVALSEMWRVLKPGGRMVITSLKPDADLSEIYRNFIASAETPAELDEGRKLLNNAGMIKIKEARGLYHFYTRKELREAVQQCRFISVRTARSFGDQANVLICSKP